MALDTGIYNALMRPSRTAFEYQADFEKQDRDREQYGQTRQMNALAMQQRQGQIGDESMARADAMGVRNVLSSGGGAPELRKLGTPEAIKQADAADQRGRETQLFDLKMASAQDETVASRLNSYSQMVSTGFVRDPESAGSMVRDMYADPVIGRRLQAMAPLEQALARIGQTPEAFADWSRRTVMGMQGMAKAEAEAEARRTAAMRADMERKRYELDAQRLGKKDAREEVRLDLDVAKADREAKTGPKLSPVAEKELFEADDLVQSSKSAADSLRVALGLNGKMYSGVEAVRRAKVRSNLPGSDPAADATIAYDNIIGAQALASLKAVFGGAPTEGERKILIDLQASADKTPVQREEILRRAIAATESRAKFNADKAAALRSGGYTAPQQTPQPTAGARQAPAATPQRQPQQAGNVLQQARDAIARGAPREAVIQRLRQNGIDPKGL
jgi:hypothetical protein